MPFAAENALENLEQADIQHRVGAREKRHHHEAHDDNEDTTPGPFLRGLGLRVRRQGRRIGTVTARARREQRATLALMAAVAVGVRLGWLCGHLQRRPKLLSQENSFPLVDWVACVLHEEVLATVGSKRLRADQPFGTFLVGLVCISNNKWATPESAGHLENT